jgi:hypothetical protein
VACGSVAVWYCSKKMGEDRGGLVVDWVARSSLLAL